MRGARPAVVVALVLTASVLSGGPARAADADPWLGPDKALHFSFSAGIAAGSYAAGIVLLGPRRDALLLGAAVTAAAGVGKEARDAAGYGDPSWKDLAWDGIGMIAGLALAVGIDLLVRGLPSHGRGFSGTCGTIAF